MKKKTAMVLSFTVGMMLFATTALAEIAAKSGYDQAKDALKFTSKSLTSKYSSYTIDTAFALKANGNIVQSESSVSKYDVKNKAQENTSIRTDEGNKFDSYYYRDKNTSINFTSDQGVYYVVEHSKANEDFMLKDPFEDKNAGDIEKIADALVGNLKDYVVVNQNSDGSKELTGSLSEAQIPALINAIVSFQIKNELGVNRGNTRNTMPVMTRDVYVKEVKGKMVVDKNGIIQSVLGTGTITGKDDSGKEQSLTFELLGKVSDINSTIVKKPDLTGKKVEKGTDYVQPSISKPELYVGTYKNNIVIEKDNKLVKIGERILEITKMDDKIIAGKYHETYISGYENYTDKVNGFSFEAAFTNDKYGGEFDYSSSSGNNLRGNISIRPDMASKLYFGIPINYGRFDSEFNRAFE